MLRIGIIIYKMTSPSDNDDPMVRGLALRSLCGLRLESIVEYVQQPLLKSLTDVSPYVRKTGVMGILKVYSRI
jgi:AP-4 complex subunit beta-1